MYEKTCWHLQFSFDPKFLSSVEVDQNADRCLLLLPRRRSYRAEMRIVD
jgi:hypothetical protein